MASTLGCARMCSDLEDDSVEPIKQTIRTPYEPDKILVDS